MWIVHLALRRPYTFLVISVLLTALGIVAIRPYPEGHPSGYRHPGCQCDLDLQRPLSSGIRAPYTVYSEYSLSASLNDKERIE